MPANPWILAPGASGAVTARVELEGKGEETLIKTLTFFTSVGERVLTLEISVAPPSRPADTPLTEAERKAAAVTAGADARAIFKGDCAACHADKARGLLGKELYEAACGICHDSPKRAGSVPDLRALKPPADLDYWTAIIARGKPHTMMPGFAGAEGGPLTELQVSSLAAYLRQTMASPPPAR
jgi:mono/diheme cytochrome c family protein